MKLFKFFLGIYFVLIISSVLNAKSINSLIDTVVVDEAFETIQMYFYHEFDYNNKKKFSEYGVKGKPIRLTSNSKPFTGILIIKSEYGEERICPFISGVPHGIWKKYNKKNKLIYDVPIKNGFYHGECKFFNSDNSQIRVIGKFKDGYPHGQFIEYGYYYNTDEHYERINVKLKTVFHNKSKSFLPYLNKNSRIPNRMEVGGIYLSDFSIDQFVSDPEPSGDMYLQNKIDCWNHRNNPLPPTEVIIEGEMIIKGLDSSYDMFPSETDENGAIKTKQRIFWKDGKCLWAEEYGNYNPKSGSSFPTYSLNRKSEYQYFIGYYLENKITRNYSRISYVKDNINRNSAYNSERVFIDSIIMKENVLINGRLKHGLVQEFIDNSHYTLMAPENKFSLSFNYAEGEYYFGTKVGLWNYYIITNEFKKLVCSTQYKKMKNPELKGFKLKLPFKKFCDADTHYIPEEIEHGIQKFYKLSDESFYVGYEYKDGEAVRLIKNE